MAYQKEIDLLKDQHTLAFNKIAWQAWQTIIKVINNHWEKICESVLQILDSPRKPTDVVANTVVENLLDTTPLDVILDLRSDCLKPLVEATPDAKCACIWETVSALSLDFALSSKAKQGWNWQE